MQRTKLIIALVAEVALSLVLVGLVSAQTTPSPTAAPNGGFWSWMGNCLRFRANPNVGTQTPATPNQGGYCGYGPCWASTYNSP